MTLWSRQTNIPTKRERSVINTHTRIDLLHFLCISFSDMILDLADLGDKGVVYILPCVERTS